MRQFTVTYKIGDGTKKKIIYDAISKTEVKRLARQDGLNVVNIRENIRIRALDDFLEKQFPSIVKLNKKTIISFFSQLLFMVEADITLVRAIENMRRNVNENKYRNFLNDVHAGLIQGKQLSDMLLPKYGFDPEIKMQIQSGEKSGNIATAIKTIVERMKNESGTRSKIMKQLSYPIIVVVIMIFVMYYILTNVVPGLAQVLIENGGDLPQITLFMINFSNAAQAYGLYVIGGIAVFVMIIAYLKNREDIGYYIDKIFLKIPPFGQVIMLSSLSRYFYVASNMLFGGITLVQSLEIAAKAISNKFLKRNLARFPDEIKKHGTQLDALMANFFPTSEYSDLVNTGLATARIDEIFRKLSDETLEKADEKVKLLTSMMEPAITIVLGGVVALLVLSLFLPMFKIMDAIK